MQKVQIFHNDSAEVFRLSRSNIEKILYCFLTKTSGGALPRQKFCQIFFWNNASINVPETCFATRRWMTPFHEWLQTIKRLKPCLHRRLDGVLPPSFSSASPGPTILLSHIGEWHTSGLYCSPSIQTPHQTRPHRSLAASLDEWKCLLQTLWNWWSLSFSK